MEVFGFVGWITSFVAYGAGAAVRRDSGRDLQRRAHPRRCHRPDCLCCLATPHTRSAVSGVGLHPCRGAGCLGRALPPVAVLGGGAARLGLRHRGGRLLAVREVGCQLGWGGGSVLRLCATQWCLLAEEQGRATVAGASPLWRACSCQHAAGRRPPAARAWPRRRRPASRRRCATGPLGARARRACPATLAPRGTRAFHRWPTSLLSWPPWCCTAAWLLEVRGKGSRADEQATLPAGSAAPLPLLPAALMAQALCPLQRRAAAALLLACRRSRAAVRLAAAAAAAVQAKERIS